MSYYWNRRDYETFHRKYCPDVSLPAYPVSTQRVVEELQDRGIEITVRQLKYLSTKKRFMPQYGGGMKGSNFQWDVREIDQVATYCASKHMLTARAKMCMALNISYDQLQKAIFDAGEKYFNGMKIDPAKLKMIVHPSKRKSEFARVEFQLPDKEGGN